MTAKNHPAAMRFIPDLLPKEDILRKNHFTSSGSLFGQPTRYFHSSFTMAIQCSTDKVELNCMNMVSDV